MSLKLGERPVTCSCTNGATDKKNKSRLAFKSEPFPSPVLELTGQNLCNVLSLRGDTEYTPPHPSLHPLSPLTPAPGRMELLGSSRSFIATCSIFFILIPLNTQSISQPTEGNPPSQQRYSRVLSPSALLFLPSLPWSSLQVPLCYCCCRTDSWPSSGSHTISPQGWGVRPAVPTDYQRRHTKLPAFALQCYTLPIWFNEQHQRLHRLQRIVSSWFLGISGLFWGGFCFFTVQFLLIVRAVGFLQMC